MYKIVYTILIVFFISCADERKYQGPVNRIVCLSSNQDKEIVQQAFEKAFADTIFTPQSEQKYDVVYKDFIDFNDYKYSSNLIIASIANPTDSTADMYANRLTASMDSVHSIFTTENGLTDNQLLVCAFYGDSLGFSDGIHNNREWIRQSFDRQINRNIIHKYNQREQNDSIKSAINSNFKLALIVHNDYTVLADGPGYIWIGRGMPYRWLMIQDVSEGPYEFSDISSNINSIEGIEGMVLSDSFRYKSERIIDSMEAQFFRGVYEYNETGGPFVSYLFSYNNRSILVSSFVNNPGYDKLPMLIQQEAIIENIKIME